MGYGLWMQNPCGPTREIQKPMGYQRVWVIHGMGYEGVDWIFIHPRPITPAADYTPLLA